jgi:hypothetical protein
MRSSTRSSSTTDKKGSLIVSPQQARLLMTLPMLLSYWSCTSEFFNVIETMYSPPQPESEIRSGKTECRGVPPQKSTANLDPGIAPLFQLCRVALDSSAMSDANYLEPKPKRLVSLRRDNADFVVAFQPEDVIVFRNPDPRALRRICGQLRWKIVSDTAYTVEDL